MCDKADRVSQAALQQGALAAGQPGCLGFLQGPPGSVPPACAQWGCHLSAVTLAQRLACCPSAAAASLPKGQELEHNPSLQFLQRLFSSSLEHARATGTKHFCPPRQHPSPAPAPSCSSQNQSHPSEPLSSIKCLRNTAGSICNTTAVGKQGSKGVWKEETPGMLELHWRAPLPPGQESARAAGANWSTERADRGEFG